MAYLIYQQDITISKVPFSLGQILPISAEDSSPPQPTAEDWSPPLIIVSSPPIQNSSDRLKISGELTTIDGGLQSSTVCCGGLESSADIGSIRPNENGTFEIIMSSA